MYILFNMFMEEISIDPPSSPTSVTNASTPRNNNNNSPLSSSPSGPTTVLSGLNANNNIDNSTTTNNKSNNNNNAQIICTCGRGLSIKMGLTEFTNWLMERTGLYEVKEEFVEMKELADMLTIPKSSLFNNPSIREDVCPSLSDIQIRYIMSLYRPDDFDPIPLDITLLDSLSSGNSGSTGSSPNSRVMKISLDDSFKYSLLYDDDNSSNNNKQENSSVNLMEDAQEEHDFESVNYESICMKIPIPIIEHPSFEFLKREKELRVRGGVGSSNNNNVHLYSSEPSSFMNKDEPWT